MALESPFRLSSQNGFPRPQTLVCVRPSRAFFVSPPNFDKDTTSTASSLTAELPVDSDNHLQLCTNAGSSNPPKGHNQLPNLVNIFDTTSGSANNMVNTSPKTHLGLTDVGNDDHGATEGVKYLLQAVGRDIVSLQRNTHVSYMVAERARDIVNAINKCIIDVENSATEDWASFDKFSKAIEPLEDMLFKLLNFADDEKGRYLAKTSSTTECVSSPGTWVDKRKEISEILNEFYTRPELVNLLNVPDTQTRERDHQDAQFHDDKTLLEEMRTQIKAIFAEDPNKFPTYVHDIKTPLDELQGAVINGSPRAPAWLMVLTIQTSMLIEGVVEIVKEATTGIEIQNHLKSKAVWEAALALINVLTENKTEPNSPSDANDKYEAFFKILGASTTITLPGSYVKLMRKVGHIRRPFQAQAITVVMLCRYLAEKFSAIDQSAITIEKFNSLEATFDNTLGSLEGATQAVPELKTFDTSDFENNGTVQAFGAAEARIRESFLSLNLSTEWTKKQTELRAAVTKDKDRLTKLQTILSNGSGDTPPAKVKVNVTIIENLSDGTEQELDATSVEGEKTMRLSALRWSVAGVLVSEDKKRAARTAGTFFQQSGSQWSKLTAHSKLEDIAGAGPEVTLKLVVA
ncbi:hypothetical protein F5888DRAFT_1803368 [Russula emetica]|nr:hypothetical protein F5888DRAFT_1803368 [Russula emetica]